MASIDGFLDHFDAGPAPRPAMRVSLRSLQPRNRKAFEPGNVLLWLLVALLHVALFLVLDFAMRPSSLARDAVDTPLQVTFISVAEPARPRAIAPPDMHRPPHPLRAFPQADTALQAIAMPPHVVTPTEPTPMSTDTRPALDLYDRQGQVRLPELPTVTRRDPFARRAASDMLPGSDREYSPGIHLREPGSPKQLVEGVAAFLFHPQPRESCSHYEERVLNADNEAERDEDLARYEHACE